MTDHPNPLHITGVNLVEFGGEPDFLHQVFTRMGFTQIAQCENRHLSLYRQGSIDFLVSRGKDSHAERFFKEHGPCVAGFGFIVQDASFAAKQASRRGGEVIWPSGGYKSLPFPAVRGIGGALVYLIDNKSLEEFYNQNFGVTQDQPKPVGAGFQVIDHFTNNVPRGEMQKWCDFYEQVFGFYENRYFHIKGKQTGLESKVMRSPSENFSIPINEPTEEKSQIQEYLDEYRGAGVQHIALLTKDIIQTMEQLNKNSVSFLTPPPSTYYRMLPERVKTFKGPLSQLERFGILVDGDDKGYLLQIFTKNMIGPIFFEVIQRAGHQGFGEGNFQALFDSIEQDQRERGYLK